MKTRINFLRLALNRRLKSNGDEMKQTYFIKDVRPLIGKLETKMAFSLKRKKKAIAAEDFGGACHYNARMKSLEQTIALIKKAAGLVP